MLRQLKCRFLFTFTLALLVLSELSAQDDLNVISDNWLEYTDASNSLYHYLSGQATILLKQRSDAVKNIRTITEWKERQQVIRERLNESIGSFPEKTPLNAKTVRTVDKGSYRIEHVIFESQPGFFVTSSFFIPAGLKKGTRYPAVIYCSGHSAEGYRSAVYIHVILNLVKKGFVVFAFDPVGQGERLEYFDPAKGKSTVGGPTLEHSYPGAQAFLTGSSQANFMIWDGIRAVDYLLTRKEVDPSRIGITGRSGGGTQSAYIAAFDERIYAAAPENYLTNYTRLLQSIGPQDAEQNLPRLIALGLDHPDFLIVRAPKPALMITTTRDMFSIAGAIETEKEVARIYQAYGKGENFSRVEDDAAHASTKANRESMYSFFQKYLSNPGSNADEETESLTPDELKVTSTGQLSTSLKGETVFSLNMKRDENLLSRTSVRRKDPSSFIEKVRASAVIFSGYTEPSNDDLPVLTGSIKKEGYTLEKYFIKGEGNYVIPYLLFRPSDASGKVLIWLHPGGKAAGAGKDGPVEKAVRLGFTVIVPDLPGTGELGPGILKGDAYFKGVSHNLWYASMLIGKSIAGIQAGEISKLAGVVKSINKDAELTVYARNELGPVLILAASLDKKIDKVIIDGSCLSFRSVVRTRFYDPSLIMSSVPGVLAEFDLPDLAGAIAPRTMIINNSTDATGTGRDKENISSDIEIIRSYYTFRNSHERLVFTENEKIEDLLLKH